MGIYDYVMGMQIKATPNPDMHNYGIGDEIQVPDGAYLCYEGVFMVRKGTIVAASPEVFDKWGSKINLSDLLNLSNPVTQAIEKFRKGGKNGEN